MAMTHGRRPAAGLRWAWTIPLLAALPLTVLLALEGAGLLATVLPGAPRDAWWYPAPGNNLFAILFLATWALTVWLWRFATTRPGPRAPRWIIVSAVLTLLLGSFSYAPCVGGSSLMAYASWVLGLFGGQVEDAVIGPDAAICTGPYPLALQIARLLGLGTLFIGAVGTLAALSQRQLDRLRLRWAADVDLVAGLSDTSISLVRALVDERIRTPRRPDWYQPSGWEKLHSLLPSRSAVAVIHPNADDPLLGEARQAGALVVIGRPSDPVLLREAILEPFGHVALRRLFAVGPSEQANIEVVDVARTILATRVGADRVGWLAAERVPRLVASFDDPRQARDWRLTQLDAPGCFVDALTTDGRMARELVNRLGEAGCRRLLLVGDTALTVAVLDELAQRRTFAAESAQAAGRPSSWALEEVQLVSPSADRVLGEWTRHRAPGALVPPGLRVSAVAADWEEAADAFAGGGGPAALVIAQGPSPGLIARATRVARMHPRLWVLCPDANAEGVAAGLPGQNLVRFGPTLLQAGGVPEDSWTVLARQQHETYRAQDTAPPDGRAARRPWGQPTDAPGDRLPEFFREDNLRQQRHVLQLVRDWDGPWVPVTSPDPALWLGRPGALVIATAIARREHERWCLLRERQGWRCPGAESSADETPGQRKLRWERSRLNPNLIDWETGQPRGGGPSRPAEEASASAEALRGGNVAAVARIVCRLYALGLLPGASAALFRRVGEVRAVRLDQDHVWTTSTGSLMRGHAGDWLVTGPDGVERTVAGVEFPQLYELVEGDRYRRLGTVTARRASARETVATLEGDAVADPGDWVVTDSRGHSWPVPDAEFRASYEPTDP